MAFITAPHWLETPRATHWRHVLTDTFKTFIDPDTAPRCAATAFFGSSVAVQGDTIVVGACADDIGGNSDQGAAYVFTRSGTVWTQQQKLIAPDGEAISASYLHVDPTPSLTFDQRSVGGVPYTGNAIGIGNIGSNGPFPADLSGAPQARAQLLTMVSTASTR